MTCSSTLFSFISKQSPRFSVSLLIFACWVFQSCGTQTRNRNANAPITI
jgi:hypothetical protein